MQTAYAYARVSTKEQANKDNSIPAQFERIEDFAFKNDIKIIGRYFDSDSAFRDEHRAEFEKMRIVEMNTPAQQEKRIGTK